MFGYCRQKLSKTFFSWKKHLRVRKWLTTPEASTSCSARNLKKKLKFPAVKKKSVSISYSPHREVCKCFIVARATNVNQKRLLPGEASLCLFHFNHLFVLQRGFVKEARSLVSALSLLCVWFLRNVHCIWNKLFLLCQFFWLATALSQSLLAWGDAMQSSLSEPNCHCCRRRCHGQQHPPHANYIFPLSSSQVVSLVWVCGNILW